MENFTVWFILTSFIISLVLEPPVAHCGGWDCAWKRPSILITMTHYITLHGPLYNSPWPSILLTMAHYIAHHGRSYQSSWPDILLTMARPTYFSLWSSISLNIIQDIGHHDPTYCSLWLSTMPNAHHGLVSCLPWHRITMVHHLSPWHSISPTMTQHIAHHGPA